MPSAAEASPTEEPPAAVHMLVPRIGTFIVEALVHDACQSG